MKGTALVAGVGCLQKWKFEIAFGAKCLVLAAVVTVFWTSVGWTAIAFALHGAVMDGGLWLFTHFDGFKTLNEAVGWVDVT
jgi:hypothetical protein